MASPLHVSAAATLEAEGRVLAWLTEHAGAGAILALSGGADSALLLDLAASALGPARVLAVTSRSESLPAEELEAAQAQARRVGVAHRTLAGSELDVEAFRRNAPDRCFHCKDSLYGQLAGLAAEHAGWQVLDGTNADDLQGHRPGFAAGLKHGVRSPLLECGVGKTLVREISRRRGLSTWDKPQLACLASRLPYGTPVTAQRLNQVGRAEQGLKKLGLRIFRVRYHGDVARLEIDANELPRLFDSDFRRAVDSAVKASGFTFVAIDLEPFRSGRLNDALRNGGGMALPVLSSARVSS